MSAVVPRRVGYICSSCRRSLQSPSIKRQLSSLATPTSRLASRTQRYTVGPFQTIRNASAEAAAHAAKTATQEPVAASASSATPPNPPEPEISTLNPVEVLASLKKDVTHVGNAPFAPPPAYLSELVSYFAQFANILVFGVSKSPDEVDQREGEDLRTSLLRDLSESSEKAADGATSSPAFMAESTMTAPFRRQASITVAELLYKLFRDPKVYITPELLHGYVRIQCMLGKAEFLPEIFHLYAHKKIPVADSSPVQYTEPWPRLPKYAIPLELAEAALEAAILKKNLDLALAILDTTVATDAFRRNKILQKASIPIAGAATLPVLAYSGATWVSEWQNTMDPSLARLGAVAGGMAYIGTLGTIGYVALTTSNDQMQRVVWRPGTGLGRRWVREEERVFLDRIALAWGYKKRERWGEETGPEWTRIRDECGWRECILDKTDLMEGMQ